MNYRLLVFRNKNASFAHPVLCFIYLDYTTDVLVLRIYSNHINGLMQTGHEAGEWVARLRATGDYHEGL